MPDLAALRAQLPSLAAETYLNTGGVGPLPVAAADAVRAWCDGALARSRGSLAGFDRAEAAAGELRDAVGRLLGDRDGDRIALTQNTTDGLITVALGIDWRPGDEIVLPSLEYPGTPVLLATAAGPAGARLRLIDPDGTAQDMEAAVGAVAGPRTRLVVLSHVSWATGAVLDVAGAVRAARRVGALVAVDAAQSAGAIPLDAAALGADAIALPAQKWLLGPEGLGALWVSAEAQGRIAMARAGYESGRAHTAEGGIEPHPGARRYEPATLPDALVAGWLGSLAWLEGIGWDRVFAGTRAAQAAGRAALAAVPGARVLTPPGAQAGLVTFTIDGLGADEAARRLAARGVIVRWLKRPPALRASLGFFSDEGDVARLAAACAAVAAGDDC